MRTRTVTEKIGRDVTGLRGSLYVHVEFTNSGRIHEIQFSERGKDESTLDNILAALGSTVTKIITEERRAG